MFPSKDISRLIDIMARLRDPETGCSWDVEQTFSSIAPYTIEEAYEVSDAIRRGNRYDLCQELGDLLLQVVYHARMAEEEGAFDFGDVVHAITTKMIRRHPHVFGTNEQRARGIQPGDWDRMKAEEKAEREAAVAHQDTVDAEAASLLDDVPAVLPNLARAVKLQKLAGRVGFDWNDPAAVIAKIREELDEFEAETTAPARSSHAVQDELGDVLFAVANLARHYRVDPEVALDQANEKFRRRFRFIEETLASEGKSPADATLETMEAIWQAAKAHEKLY